MSLIGTKRTLWVRTRRAVQWDFCLRIGTTLVAIFGSQYVAHASMSLRRFSSASLGGHHVRWKGWNACRLAAILWRSGRFATLVFLRSIVTGAASVGGDA